MDVLAARSLTIGRGRLIVLRDVDLRLRAGAVVHVAGENGSGKTSLLRVLAGLASPRGGELRRAETCAFVPERVQLAPALRPAEWLGAMRRLRGLAPYDWAQAAAGGGLDPAVLERPSAKLSKGMLQRVALLEAVHAAPALLLLDEPFSGLDGEGREWLSAQLDGPAVLLTDHSGTVRPAERLRLSDGACTAVSRIAQLTILATRDGERLERTLPEDESDAALRELLAGGWHVERVQR
jgi:ABC-type transport system involved in cytochrome c biogenesis ATPase subunit